MVATKSFSWDAAAAPLSERFDSFVEGVCRAFAHLDPILINRDAAFHARIEHRETNDIAVTNLGASNYLSRRTPAGISRSDSHDFFINYVVSGSIQARQQANGAALSSGAVFVLDNARPFELVMPPDGAFRSTVIRVGRPRFLEENRDRLLNFEAAFAGNPLLPLLKMNLAQLSAGSHEPDGNFEFFGQTVIRLLEMIVSGTQTQAPDHHERSLNRIICLEIDRHIWDLEFSLEQLAVRLAMSPRKIQRVLAEHDLTFSSYLRDRRLSAAAARLQDGRETRSIEEIAAESGFRDISTFYRSFKRRYGINPGDLRKS